MNRVMREWAIKRLCKLERRLLYFAKIYFGEQVTITYETPKVKTILFPDGEFLELKKVVNDKEEPCD